MTLVADPAVPRRGLPGSAWAAPLWAHLAALATILLALMAFVGTSSSFSADEGAVVIQATSLAGGEGWRVDHPMPEVDPTGANYPLELSQRGARGWAPFAKHPLYGLLLAGAGRLGGVTAMVLLSMAGTVVAAGLAGALARRLDPALARPAIWATGLASPLLFDGYLLIAHTLGAALAATAVLAAVVAIERRSPRLALAVVPAVAAGVLLRSEALFLAGALAAVAGVLAWRRRDARSAAAVVALGSLLAGLGARVVEGLWTASLLGGGGAALAATAPAASGSSGLVAGRIDGFVLTWLTPSYGGRALTGLALLVMLSALAVSAVTARLHPGDRRRIVGWASLAAAASVVALLSGPRTVVPGLLLAFPIVLPGLLVAGRHTLSCDTARVLAGAATLFVVAVAATQYAKGGGGEWGGRYFALAIPLGVPVLLLALRDQAARLPPAVARRSLVGLAVCSLALSAMGIGALRESHMVTARLVAAADRAGRTVAAEDPVMVTTEGAMPRFAWPTFDRQRWLLTDPAGLEGLLDRLRVAGVTRVAFVTRHLERDQAGLDAAGASVTSAERPAGAGGWHVLVLQVA